MKIEYVGRVTDTAFKNAIENERENAMSLNDFYNSINQPTDEEGYCNSCKNKRKIYAVCSYLDDIVQSSISLCLDCTRRLPDELDVVNLYSNGAPPRLHLKN